MAKTLKLAACFALGLGGCAGLLGKPVTQPEVLAASDRGDTQFLTEVCQGARPADGGAKAWACAELDRANAGNAASGSCDTLVDKYRKSDKKGFQAQETFAKALARCGHYEVLFQEVAAWGPEGEGGKLLGRVEDASYPIEGAFAKYLMAHQGASLFGGDHPEKTMRHVTVWLTQKARPGQCAPLAQALEGAEVGLKYQAMPFFAQSKCKEAEPYALELLGNDDPAARVWACKVLGEVGDASAAPKVKALVESDPYFETRLVTTDEGKLRDVKLYHVRDTCGAALGKIKARGK